MQPILVAMASALLVSSTAALAGHWIYLGADARGNAWHIDTDFVDHEQHKITAWKRIDFGQPYPRTGHGVQLRRAFVLNVIDCAERRTDFKAVALVDLYNSVVAIEENGGRDFHWPPGARIAPMDGAISLVCSEDRAAP